MKVLLIALFAFYHSANAAVVGMSGFDAAKFKPLKWWVISRGFSLYKDEHCLTVNFQDENGLQFVIGNKDAINKYPAAFDSTGWNFTMDNNKKVSVTVVYTDYATWAAVHIDINENGQQKEMWAIYSKTLDLTDAKLADEIAKHKSESPSLAQIPTDLSKVDNAGCTSA